MSKTHTVILVEIQALHDFNRVVAKHVFFDRAKADVWANAEIEKRIAQANKKDPRNADIHNFAGYKEEVEMEG